MRRSRLRQLGGDVSESIRAALADADALIARVTARLAGDPSCVNITADTDTDRELTATAERIADDCERRLETIAHESRLADAARGFRQRWPALVRWREKVLANRRHERPSVIAAAYESLALECLLAGEYELSARAQHEAVRAMESVVRRVGTASATAEAKSA